MQVYYDLHIHSALSPCADDDMTPNNIVNMAKLKGLDVIAVSDHNCAENVEAVARVAKEAGLLFIPAVEMTTIEEVHLLVFFEVPLDAQHFGNEIYCKLPNIPNKPDYFGRQLMLDQNDQTIGTVEKMLISALPYNLEESCALARDYGGYVIPAHINKRSNSMLANLGFFPPNLSFKTIEIVKGLEINSNVSRFKKIYSSDAHCLWQIAERENYLEVEEMNVRTILQKLCG